MHQFLRSAARRSFGATVGAAAEPEFPGAAVVGDPASDIARAGPLCRPVLLRDLGEVGGREQHGTQQRRCVENATTGRLREREEAWRFSPVFTRAPSTRLPSSHQVRCMPLFTIIGAQKAGTTSLFKYLGQHPSVGLPAEKELNFWGTPWPSRHRHRLQSLGAFTFKYLGRFKGGRLGGGGGGGGGGGNSSAGAGADAAGGGGLVVSGEASPDYLVSTRSALPNILRFAPSMKVIVSLREPIDRFVSAYKNKVRAP